jgi:hypothetical protein
MRNTNKLNGNATGMNYEVEVLRFMKINGIDDLYLISVDSKRYYGKYGCLVETWYDGTKHWYCNPRKVYKLIKQYYNPNRLEIKVHKYEDDDGYDATMTTHFMFDRDYNKLVFEEYDDGSKTNLIRLGNGQLYDIEDIYWYSMKDSKELKQDIKNGYKYKDANMWNYDSYESEDDKIQRLEREATSRLIRSSMDKLLSNPEFKTKVQIIANWIYNHERMLDDERVSSSTEAFRNYAYGYPGHILYSPYTNLHYAWITSKTKPVYAKHLIKNKVEYDYASNILESSSECLEVLRRNFPKLDSIIKERLVNPFSSLTLEELETAAMPVANYDWTRAMSNLHEALGLRCIGKSWIETLM